MLNIQLFWTVKYVRHSWLVFPVCSKEMFSFSIHRWQVLPICKRFTHNQRCSRCSCVQPCIFHMDCSMFWYLSILLHLLYTWGNNASCYNDILFSGPSNLCNFVLQILDSHLGSHFSNLKLNEFYVFRLAAQFTDGKGKKKSVNYLSYWYYVICQVNLICYVWLSQLDLHQSIGT